MSRDAHDEAGPISHDEAENIALAYIDYAFGNPEKPGRRVRHCIPANPKTDTDIRLMAYIKQQRAAESRSAPSRDDGWVSVEERNKWAWLLEAARDVLFANENIVTGMTREQAERVSMLTLREAVDRFPHPCAAAETPGARIHRDNR